MTTQEIINMSQKPRTYYARHMQPGLAKYENETILVDVDALKKMMPSAVNMPVYIYHQDVDLKTMKEKAAGYVTESFYNALDGFAWFKIIGLDDELHNAVDQGWSVSNAYRPTQRASGGTKNNCPYDSEILDGEFTHLAIVPDPRYESACIMTPEQFKAYQDSKKHELDELQNSKSDNSKGKFTMKLFKTKREEVSAVDAETQIELEGGQVVTIQEMLNSVAADKARQAKEKEIKNKKNSEDDEDMMENEVDCDGEKMSVKELKNRYVKMNSEKKNADDEAKKKADDEKKNAEDAEKAKKDKDEDEKKNALEAEKGEKNFLEILNANAVKEQEGPKTIDTSMDMVARGKSRYGSAA